MSSRYMLCMRFRFLKCESRLCDKMTRHGYPYIKKYEAMAVIYFLSLKYRYQNGSIKYPRKPRFDPRFHTFIKLHLYYESVKTRFKTDLFCSFYGHILILMSGHFFIFFYNPYFLRIFLVMGTAQFDHNLSPTIFRLGWILIHFDVNYNMRSK